MMERLEECMAVVMDKCTTRVRVRDAHRDEKKNKKKKKRHVYCIWRCL